MAHRQCLAGCGTARDFYQCSNLASICDDCFILITNLPLVNARPEDSAAAELEQMARFLAAHPKTRDILMAAYRLGARDQLRDILASELENGKDNP